MKLSTPILAAVAFLAAGAANATIITAQDNFDGNSSGSGFANAWDLAQKPRTVAIKSSALVITGDAEKTAQRTLSTAQDSDVFVNFTLRYTGAELGGNDFVGMWFDRANGPSIGLKANCGITTAQTACTDDLFVRMGGTTGGTFLKGSNLTKGVDYQISGHMYKSGDNGDYYDRFDAWFQPASGDLAKAKSSFVTASGKINFTSFTDIGFRSVNIDKGLTVSVDNLNIGEVPEPSSVALMGLALACLGAASRRKRS